MYMLIKLIILILLIWILVILKDKSLENFIIWKPQVIDPYNQPSYTSYFYHNNYMYPL